MTTKLTLTIDDTVVAVAKKYAKKKGRRLSEIVSNYLCTVTSKEKKADSISPKILELMGTIELPKNFKYKKSLASSIEKKYR